MPRHVAAVALLLLTFAGCDGVSQVTGKVTVRGGEPPQGATVVFTDEAKHRSASGTVGADGSYSLTSKSPGDGAPPGTYQVTVHTPSAADSSQAQPPRTFHTKYENPSSSTLTREVKSGNNEFNLELDPP